MSKEIQNNKILNKNSSINKDSNEIRNQTYENKEEEALNNKINKPNELRYFDAITHFKQNITHFDKNCSEPVKDNSYYCFSCKHSVCNECGAYDHKEHLLIQRDNCLNYDETFFNEIANVIENGINIESKKIENKRKYFKFNKNFEEGIGYFGKRKIRQNR